MPAPELPDWIRDERYRIGQRIRHLRRQADLTQGEVVSRSGIDRRTLQRIESGITDTRLSRLQVIARAIGVPLAELVRDDGPAAGLPLADDGGQEGPRPEG